jgi:hypothetical protein
MQRISEAFSSPFVGSSTLFADEICYTTSIADFMHLNALANKGSVQQTVTFNERNSDSHSTDIGS